MGRVGSEGEEKNERDMDRAQFETSPSFYQGHSLQYRKVVMWHMRFLDPFIILESRAAQLLALATKKSQVHLLEKELI